MPHASPRDQGSVSPSTGSVARRGPERSPRIRSVVVRTTHGSVLVQIIDLASQSPPEPGDVLRLDIGSPNRLAQQVTGKFSDLA